MVLVAVVADDGLRIKDLVVESLRHSGLKEQRGASSVEHRVVRRGSLGGRELERWGVFGGRDSQASSRGHLGAQRLDGQCGVLSDG